MTITVTDQRPATLDPVHILPIQGDYDPIPAICETLVDPMFEPLPGRTVAILDGTNSLDQDAVLSLHLRTLGDSVDQDAEDDVKSLFTQTLVHFDPNTPFLANSVFTVQAAAASKLPAPSNNVVYSAGTDVVPAAKAMLASADDTTERTFLASLGYTYSPETLGFWFLTESAYEDFKVWFDAQVAVLGGVLPADTTNLLQQFSKLRLSGLTESLVLRADDADQLQEYSFARVLVHLFMRYAEQMAQNVASTPGTPKEMGVLPFTSSELFCPRTVVLVNVEAHARSTARRVDAEWKLIQTALASPVRVISMKNLSKLTAAARAAAKARGAAATAATNRNAQNVRASRVAFRKRPPSGAAVLKDVMRVLKRMKEVNRSQNIFTKSKVSFLKANRRDPMDFNKPGRMTSKHYLPDLHIYVDTSGSISEANYQQAVMMMIRLAKKLDVNLYFNSFSHMMSQEILLRTKGRSVESIWREFQKLPKVGGGTDYEQIWHYVNMSKARRERLSLVVTDFEWCARPHRVDHPKNLYYAPCGNLDWTRMVHYAKEFSKSARHIDPGMGNRLLGMTI